MPREITNFLLWCNEHGIEIDERLEIRESLLDGGISVFSKSDGTISIGESLVRIPKTSVFSVKNCSRSRDIPAGKDDAALELSLAFVLETLLAESPWRGYFASLPATVDLAIFWGLSGARDHVEAKEWLEGTEAGKILSPPTGPSLLHRIDTYFENVAKGVLSHLQLPTSLQIFRRAYSLISSRAFLVDAYHGLSLVPVADAFNHVEDNHVHLESDYHVCPACGALDECEHDTETPAKPRNIGYENDTCEMVANLPIRPGQEVFNSYENGLTNAELLCQYGFILDGNENNVVSWSVDELLRDIAKPDETRQLWAGLMSLWPSNPGWGDAQLVYNPRREDEDEDGVPTAKRANLSLLTLNADGQISHPLWLFLYTLVLSDVDAGTVEALSEVRQAARAQERIESEGIILDPWPLSVECRRPLNLIRHVARKVTEICENKIASAHCTAISASRIGELLDEIPSERRLTRLAMSYALEERKLVQACHAAWTEFAELLGEFDQRSTPLEYLGSEVTFR